MWNFHNPLADAQANVGGGVLTLTANPVRAHDLDSGTDTTPRVLHDVPGDGVHFDAGFLTAPTTAGQMEGVTVQKDRRNFVRMGVTVGSPGHMQVTVITANDGAIAQVGSLTIPAAPRVYLQLRRFR